MCVPLGVKIGAHSLKICHMEIGVRPGATSLERVQVRTPTPTPTFSHDATVLQVRLTTMQKLVVRHLKCHGLGSQIANRLVTGLYQHFMGLPKFVSARSLTTWCCSCAFVHLMAILSRADSSTSQEAL